MTRHKRKWRDPNVCPKCGGRMVQRRNKKDNSKFLGCSNFPECRHTRNYPGGSTYHTRQANTSTWKRGKGKTTARFLGR